MNYMTTPYLEEDYLFQVAPRLRNFKKKSTKLFNFSCPFCGDSKKKKSRARGYIYVKNNGYYYKCHNCGMGTTFSVFLEKLDYELFKDFQMKKFFEKKILHPNIYVPTPEIITKSPDFKKDKNFFDLPKIIDLERSHPARIYIEERLIPIKWQKKLYFAEDFPVFVKKLNLTKEYTLKADSRIVIPSFNQNNELVSVQGRAIEKTNPIRYITIKVLDEPAVFNLNEIKNNYPVFVTEGAFDSMFLPNAVAVNGSDLKAAIKIISDPIFIFDNEKRNKEICKKMMGIINLGHKIVIWPKELNYKDINEMIINNVDPLPIIKGRIYKDLSAQAEFEFWRNL